MKLIKYRILLPYILIHLCELTWKYYINATCLTFLRKKKKINHMRHITNIIIYITYKYYLLL